MTEEEIKRIRELAIKAEKERREKEINDALRNAIFSNFGGS